MEKKILRGAPEFTFIESLKSNYIKGKRLGNRIENEAVILATDSGIRIVFNKFSFYRFY
jgi:hypothetical protein